MKPLETFLAAALASGLLAGAAFAEANHGHAGQAGPGQGGQPAMGMPGMKGAGQGMMPMMQMMMCMHGDMMGAGMGMGMGMAGDGIAAMPGLNADADGDGTVTPHELRTRLQALLSEYDANADGSLSLDEFASLHAALTRETMVDRFQFLDDDGDGAVSAAEIAKPARLMDQMQAKRGRMMDRAPDRDADAMPGQGGMMQDN